MHVDGFHILLAWSHTPHSMLSSLQLTLQHPLFANHQHKFFPSTFFQLVLTLYSWYPDRDDIPYRLLAVLYSPSLNIHNVSLLDDIKGLMDDYESQLIKSFTSRELACFPVFNLILLGMGPDGHTAPLFPGHKLSKSLRWVAYIEDSPKPPPNHITLMLPIINHVARVVFIATMNCDWFQWSDTDAIFSV